MPDELGHDGVEGRPLQPVEPGEKDRDGKQHPQLGMRQESVGHENGRDDAHAGFRRAQHPPPVDRVGEGAPDEGSHEQRDELGQAEEADDE